MARTGDRNAERVERSEIKRRVNELVDELSLLPQIDFADPAQVAERCRHHRLRCKDMGLVPTVGTLVVSLGITMWQLDNFARGEQSTLNGCGLTKESATILQKELAMLEAIFDAHFENGSYANPVVGIFAAKNLFGWKDTKEVRQQVTTVEITPDQIQARYSDAIPLHMDPQGEVHRLMDGSRASGAARKARRIEARIDAGDFPEYEIP